MHRRLPLSFLVYCCIALPVASLTAKTILIDDLQDGNNANEFENYWYYHDDNYGVKADDRPQAGKGTRPSTIDVPYTQKNREAFGNKQDTVKVRDYSFTTQKEAGNGLAVMPFTFGDKWKASWCNVKPCAFPFVEMGTMLAAEGSSIDLTGSTGISFKIRSRKNMLNVTFKVETKDITDDSTEAFYETFSECVPGAWTEHIILFTDLAQPAWAKPDRIADFTISKVTNIAWQVKQEDNTLVTGDTLDIDDVTLIDGNGVTSGPFDVWSKVETTPPSSGLFMNFETRPKHMTPFGYGIFAFTDEDVGGNSIINQGAERDPEFRNRFSLKLDDPGSGADNSYGAYIIATAGDPLTSTGGTATQFGYAGLGFNTYDSAHSAYFNAAASTLGPMTFGNPVNSIYFEYQCDGDFPYLTLEILDIHDVRDANEPNRARFRGPGQYWCRKFPATGGAWQKVLIPFDSLVVHLLTGDAHPLPLDKTRIARIQFSLYGNRGKNGMLAVDNIYFPGMSFIPAAIRPMLLSSSDRLSKLIAKQNATTITLQSPNLAHCKRGTVNLISTRGSIVRQYTIALPAQSIALPTPDLPAGRYIVQFRGTLSNGKQVSEQTPVVIVR